VCGTRPECFGMRDPDPTCTKPFRRFFSGKPEGDRSSERKTSGPVQIRPEIKDPEEGATLIPDPLCLEDQTPKQRLPLMISGQPGHHDEAGSSGLSLR